MNTVTLPGSVAAVEDLEGEIKQLGKDLDLAETDVKDWGSVWANQVSTIVTDFSAGIADIILEGKGFKETFTGIFKEAGKAAIRTLTEELFDKGVDLLKDFGSGVVDAFGSIFSGGGAGGAAGGAAKGGLTAPTASFTELGITGVAIQTGIFGTGIGITGVTIQKGEFHTGVALSGLTLSFGGGTAKGIDSNVFEIKQTLAHQMGGPGSKLVFWEMVKNLAWIPAIGAADGPLWNLNKLAGESVGLLKSIDSRLGLINININQSNTIAESGIFSARSIGRANRDLAQQIKDILARNEGGVRTAIAEV